MSFIHCRIYCTTTFSYGSPITLHHLNIIYEIFPPFEPATVYRHPRSTATHSHPQSATTHSLPPPTMGRVFRIRPRVTLHTHTHSANPQSLPYTVFTRNSRLLRVSSPSSPGHTNSRRRPSTHTFQRVYARNRAIIKPRSCMPPAISRFGQKKVTACTTAYSEIQIITPSPRCRLHVWVERLLYYALGRNRVRIFRFLGISKSLSFNMLEHCQFTAAPAEGGGGKNCKHLVFACHMTLENNGAILPKGKAKKTSFAQPPCFWWYLRTYQVHAASRLKVAKLIASANTTKKNYNRQAASRLFTRRTTFSLLVLHHGVVCVWGGRYI